MFDNNSRGIWLKVVRCALIRNVQRASGEGKGRVKGMRLITCSLLYFMTFFSLSLLRGVRTLSTSSRPQSLTVGAAERLKSPLIIEYDTAKYPFKQLVAEMLDLPPLQDLSSLHTSTPLGTTVLTDKSGAQINYFQSCWNRDRDKTPEQRGPAFVQFNALYRSFVSAVIAPAMEISRSDSIIFQRAPTLRVYPPGGQTAMGSYHNDEQYHHQPSEINFWLPISERVWGSNSLWVESSPGLGDFAPLDLSYGQVFRGYLNQCRHGCQANLSGATRVSVDFRVVSDVLGGHNAEFRRGVRRGPKAKYQNCFDLGGFYDVIPGRSG